MDVYEYIPQKSNKKAIGIIIILTTLALVLFAFTLIFPSLPLKWIPQLIAIIAFVCVIFIISRYIAKSFLYTVVKNDDDTLDLTVTELTNAGRKKITVCRIAIANIEEAHLIDSTLSESIAKVEALQKKAKSEHRKSFNYCPDINPSEFCILLVDECGEKFILKLSPDATLWGYLSNK